MNATFKLPPSQRDFEVFFAVAFQSVSTRDAARLHNISQTRVRQLVTLVGDWVADNLPDWNETDLQKQLRLAQQIVANRLEHQYESAMRLWDVEGDPRHLRAATRIAQAQARLGVVAGRVHALAADVTEGPAELADDFPPVDAHSPNGDCSPAGNSSPQGQADADAEVAVSDTPEMFIERERWQRLREVEGAKLFESRLLSLIEGQGEANPERVEQLYETLTRVREHKATAEPRLSRFIHGVHIEPLDLQSQPAEAGTE